MFEYFDGNYAWNLTAVTLIEEVGTITEPAEAFAAVAAYADAPTEQASVAWYEAMTNLGHKLERLAKIDLSAGHELSAARKFHRSSMYFIRAERLLSHEDPRRIEVYGQAIANYRLARDLGRDGVEFVDIPYGGGFMPALLIRAEGVGGEPAPLVVHLQGFDSVKETQFPMLHEYRRRGLSCLIVDQPGTGGALRLHGLTATVETEGYVGTILDWVHRRADLATDRLGLVGLSMGGYFAPRAAAFEPRVKACAAWGALYDAGRMVAAIARTGDAASAPSVPEPIKHALWVFGLSTPEEFAELANRMTLSGIVERLTCPLLVMHGENDRQVPVDHARRTYDNAGSKDKTLKIFTRDEGGAEHCQIDNRSIAADYISDWFAEKL